MDLDWVGKFYRKILCTSFNQSNLIFDRSSVAESTPTTMWQLRVHRLLFWIHSNHKYSHLCFSLSSLCSNWSDHQALNINLDLDNSKCVWRQTPLDLTSDSHTQHKQQHKNMARVFPFILKEKHKTLHVIWTWAKLENSAEKHSARALINRV